MINTEMKWREWSVSVCVIRVCVFQHRPVDSAQVPYDDFCAVFHLSLTVSVVYLVKFLVYVVNICMAVISRWFYSVNIAL